MSRPTNDKTAYNHGIFQGKLVSFNKDCRRDTSSAPVYMLADLVNQYECLLEEMNSNAKISSTV